jgi:uncharacterized lipoprotein
MKSQVLLLPLTVLACLLASCSSAPSCGNPHSYLGNTARPPLQAPAGVTLPRPDPAYLVPGAATKVAATPAPALGTAAAPCLVVPPSVLTKEDMSRAPSVVPKQKLPPVKDVPGSLGSKPDGGGGPPVAANKGME